MKRTLPKFLAALVSKITPFKNLSALVVLLLMFSGSAWGQSSANYTFTTNATGSLALDANGNAVDMTTGTTQLVGAGLDATASSVTNIGFDFYFMANRFTQFSVQEDGILQLGGTAVSTNTYILTGGTLTAPRLSAFNQDMRTGTTTGKIHYKIIGNSPNRCLVVEFTDMQIFWTSTAAAGTSKWQMRLYEKTGQIEYVYGTMTTTAGTAGGPDIGFYTGATINSSFRSVSFATHTSSTATYAVNAPPTVPSTITNLNSTADGSRRVYKFTPPTPAAGPSNLTFASVTVTTTTLNWTAASPTTNSVKYAVFNSTNGGTTYNYLTTVALGTNTYAATGLTPGTSYTWKVVTISEGVESTSAATGTQATTAAATYYYVGAATGSDFATAASWNTNPAGGGINRGTPLSSDILIVDGIGTTNTAGGITLTITTAQTLGSLQITNSTAVTLQSNTTTQRILTLSTAAGDELSIGSGSSLLLTNITNSVSIVFSGTGSTGTIAGTLTVAGASTTSTSATANSFLTTGGTGTVVTVSSTGVINNTATTNITTNGNVTGSAASLIFANGSQYNVSGATTAAPWIPLATWGATSNMTISGLTSSSTTATNNVQSFGNFIYNCPLASGTLNFFSSSTTAVIQGNLTITATGTGLFRALNSGTLTVNGNVDVNGGTLQSVSSTGTLIVLGNTTVYTNGILDINGGTYSQRGTTFTNNGTLTGVAASATLQFLNFSNIAQTYTGTGSVLTNVGTISLQNGGGLTISTTNTTPVRNVYLFIGTITGSNLITIGTGASSSCSVQIGATGLTTSGGSFAAAPVFALGTGTYTVLYSGETTARTTGFEIPSTRTVTSVTVDNTNGVTLSGGDLTIGGTLTLTTGQFAIGSNVLTLSGSPIAGTGAATNLITTSSSSLVFSGSTTGHFVPASVTNLSDLTLNYTGASGVTVNGPLNASALVLTSGKLNTTTTNILTVTGTGVSAVTGGSSTAYVNGPLQRTLPASLSGSNTYLMPIGKTAYNSFDLINPVTNAGGMVVVKAEVFDVTTGGTSGTDMGALNTNRYWISSLTSGAVNFSNTSIRIADVSGIGTANGIGQSSSLTGSYNLVSSAAPVASSITSDNINSLSFFVMGAINIAASDYYSKATGNLDDLTTWGTNIDGTGTNPTNFTNNGQTFNIRNNATPTIGAAWTISGAGSKAVLGDGTNTISFTVPASFAMSGLLNVSANSTLTLNNDAVPILGTVNTNSTVEYAGAGSQNIAGVTYGNLISSNTGARVLANTGTVGIAGNFTTGTNVYTVTGSTVDFNGTIAQNISDFTFNNLTISNAAGVTQTGDVSVAGILLVNQNLTVNATRILTLSSGASCTIATTKQLSVNGTIVSNSIAASPFTVTGTLIFNSGSVYQHNANTAFAAIPSTNTTYSLGSLLKVTGVTSTIASLPATIGGDVEWNSTAQTVSSNFLGSATNTIGGKLTIISTGTGYVTNGFSATARTLNITGNLDIQGGNYYISGTSSGTVAQLTTAANVTVSGGQLIMNTGSGSAGSGTLTIGAAGNLTLTGGTIAINNSTASTGTGTLTIPGNLNMSAGTFSIAGGTGTGSGAATLNVAGNANISGGTFNMTTTTGTSAATFNLQGNFAHSAGTFTRNSNAVSTIVINGTSAQSITTNGFTVGGGTGEHSLTVNNSAGVTLNSSVQIGGTLTLTSGLVNTTAANLLSLGNATTAGILSGGSSTAYINGPFARTFPASRTATGTYTVATLYPVGKNATYLPLYIDPTTTAGGAIIMNGQAFTTNSGTAGVGVSTLSTNRWEALISSGSGNFTSTNLRIADGSSIVATSQIFQATSAGGAYTTVVPTSTYTAGPPNTLTTTGSQILAADYSGYFAYGDAACVGANAGTATAATSNMCLSGSTTISASGYTIAAGITYQWQSATDLAFTTPVDIGSASSTYANLSTGTISSTTYYRLKVICGPSSTTAYTATPATVNVNNPSVASTTPGSRCGTGTVTLGATLGGNATTLNWYAAASGGASLGSGTSFTTPNISTSTAYYVGSSVGTVSSNLGNTAIPTSTGASSERGIVFTANQNFILISAQYYSPTLSVTNTVTVRLVDNVTGTQIGSSLVLPIVQGTSAGFYTMNLNLSITPGTYRLLAGFSSSVNRQSSGADYTNIAYNNLGSFGSITSGYDSGVSTTTYNYFHNILIQSVEYCESSRTSVLATITSPPAITANGTTTICSGNSTTLSVSSDNTNYTYAWAPSTGLSASTGASVTASPTTTTTYTVTATDSSSGCVTTANVTVTVNALPSAVTLTPSSATICNGSSQSIAASGGTGLSQLASNYSFSASNSQTLNTMVGSTTLLASAVDNTASAVTTFPSGFVFPYEGVNQTQFSVSDNGVLRLGSTAVSTTQYGSVTGQTLLITPWGADMGTGSNGGVKYLLTGSSPNRIFIVQYETVHTWSTSNPINNTYQIWLYETTGQIQFRYGSLATSGTFAHGIGICGSSITNYQSVVVTTGLNSTASVTSNTTAPASGVMYSFTPPFVNTMSWNNTTSLYTDSGTTTAYSGNPRTVYAKPSTNTTYTATATNAAGCTSSNTVTITVTPTNTAGTASSTPTLCANSLLTNITHSTTGATGIGTATGLPAGVTAAWASNAITISGTPTASGTFNYSIPLTGGCGSVNATGTITVNPKPNIANKTTAVCNGLQFLIVPTNGTDIVPIGTTYTWNSPSAISGITGLTAGTNTTAISGTLTNSTSAAIEVVYQVTPSANVVPISSPVTINFADRLSTYSSVNINGQGNTASVTAGSTVNLSYSFAVSYDYGPTSCPGCVVQSYIGIGGTNQTIDCQQSIYGGSSGNINATFTAPTSPGVYYLTQTNSLAYSCSTQSFNNNPANAIGVFVVGSNAYTCPGTPFNVTVTVNPEPTALVVSGSLTCTGATGTITSSTSVSGVNYQLFDSSNATVGTAVSGTGSALTWSSIAIGTGYYVKATNATTTCVSSNSNAVAVGTITDKTWLGTTDTSWNTASNWSCGTLPSSSDVIVISSGSPVLDTNFTVGATGSLTLSGTGTLTINSASTLTIAGTANFGDKAVTIKSNATGNGAIGQVTGTLSGATNVTVERYIPAKRSWRAITAPVTMATSINANWQEGGTANTTNGFDIWDPNGGTGIITGGVGSSLLEYSSSANTWTGITNTTAASSMLNGSVNKPFMAFVTGPYGSNNVATGAAITTLRATGTLLTGDKTYATTANKYAFIGNPYASPLNLTAMLNNTSNATASFGGNVWVWDANVLGTYSVGTYNLFDFAASNYSNTSNNANISGAQIQSGQAFFVKSTDGASFTIKEAHKGSVFTNAVFRSGTPEILRVNLFKQVNNEWAGRDGAMEVIFSDAAADQAPNKMANGSENIAFTKNGALFASEHHLPLVATDVLKVKVWNTIAGANYKLKINTEQFTSTNLNATLEDLFTNSRTPLTLDGSMVEYPFTVTTDALSSGDRFRIVFQSAILGTNNPTANGFSIVPNPVTGDSFQVNLGTLATGNYSYSICNAIGQEVEKGSIQNATQNTNYTVKFKENAATGIYIMKIKGTDNSVFTAKIIKK